jgi:transposase
MSRSCLVKPLTVSEKKITRAYKEKLTKAERKEFRSRMWEFRRDPSSLTAEEKAKLEALFEKLPQLRKLYELRVEFKRIFDESKDRRAAELALTAWIMKLLEAFPEMDQAFVKTYEHWQEEILNSVVPIWAAGIDETQGSTPEWFVTKQTTPGGSPCVHGRIAKHTGC